MREQRIFMAPVEDCNVIFRHSRLQKWIPKTLRNALRLSVLSAVDECRDLHLKILQM